MLDFEKFTKYSKSGPRYTSYPTAVEFGTQYDLQTHIGSLKEAREDLSIYVHLPFCRSACYFCGCNVIYTSRQDKKTRYIEYLHKELKILSSLTDTQRSVKQFHFGGGTPTFFSAKELDEIMKLIKTYFPNFSNDGEISCEIDPRFFNDEQMSVLSSHGFNRLSFGVQDFNEKVQEATNRFQSTKTSQDSIALARKYGIKSINVDLIYGLPYQSVKSFEKTLEMTKELDPARLAIFHYAHVPWIKTTMKKIDESAIPDPKTKLEIFKLSIDYLHANGYEMIGLDHFAKPDDELFLALGRSELTRNFQGYTTHKNTQLLGLGLTSIGYGKDWYAQNHKGMKSYEKALDDGILPLERGIKLSKDDLVRKETIMHLMANFSLDFAKINAMFGINFFEYFAQDLPKLKPFIDDGLVKLGKEKLEISPTGRLLIRNIAMTFDAYLKKNDKKFSKTL